MQDQRARLKSWVPHNWKRSKLKALQGLPQNENYQSEEMRRRSGFILSPEESDREIYLREERERLEQRRQMEIDKKQKELDELDTQTENVWKTISNEPITPVKAELPPPLQKIKDQEEALRQLEEQSKRLKMV